jgi:hypothetical protein
MSTATVKPAHTQRAFGSVRVDGIRAGLRPRRRPSLVLTGVLLAVVCAAAFVWLQLNTDRAVDVLAVARPVAAGQVIGPADVRVARLVPDPSVPMVFATEASSVVGRTAAVPLVAGSLVSPAQLGPAAGWPRSGEAVLAVAVKPGRIPVGVVPGARVQVFTVVAVNATGPSGVAGSPVVATVVEVRTDVDSSGTTVVSLLVPATATAAVAASGADVALVLLAAQG